MILVLQSYKPTHAMSVGSVILEDIVGQHYMTYQERIRMETLLKYKVPIAQIARELGCCRQTIYNEMKRGTYEHEVAGFLKPRYSADKGQSIHDRACRNRGRDLKIGSDLAYANFLEEKMLRDKYSPAAALAAAQAAGFAMRLCVRTVYNYIEQGVFYAMTSNDLWEKPRRRKKAQRPEQRVVHPKLPSIEQRPQHIRDREDLGHWEMDLIVGAKSSKAALLVLTERITREVIIRKIPDKKTASVVAAIDDLEKKTPDFREKVQSITTDNGSEFLDYEGLRRSIYYGERCDIWYCHSFASWEKGTIERNNRIIRRFFPKGTDFSKVTKKQVAAVQDWMNNYPRKILDWKTPREITSAA